MTTLVRRSLPALVLACAAAAPARAQDAVALALAHAATDSTMAQPTSFTFTVGGKPFAVLPTGAGVRGGADSAAFALQVPAGARIDRVYYGAAGGDVMVAYETADPDGGTTGLARLDGASLLPRWTQRLPTLNLAAPLIAGKEMYVAGLDFLARLDAETGDFMWQKTMLAPAGARAFQAFNAVALDGERVAFTEEVRGRAGRVIRARRSDGGIIEIAPAR